MPKAAFFLRSVGLGRPVRRRDRFLPPGKFPAAEGAGFGTGARRPAFEVLRITALYLISGNGLSGDSWNGQRRIPGTAPTRG